MLAEPCSSWRAGAGPVLRGTAPATPATTAITPTPLQQGSRTLRRLVSCDKERWLTSCMGASEAAIHPEGTMQLI